MNPSRRRRRGAWWASARSSHHPEDRPACGSWQKGCRNRWSWLLRPGDVGGSRVIGLERELPQRRFASPGIDSNEAEALVKVPDHDVLRSRDVLRAQYAGAAFARRFNGDIHGLELEFAPEYAAAHDPRVDVENAGLCADRPHDHRADEAVVAESIDETEL